MKNIRLYEAPKYAAEEYKKVGDGIYKTTVIPRSSGLSLMGVMDEELVEKLASLEGWEDGQDFEDEDLQIILFEGKKYYRDKSDPDIEDQEIIYYEPFGMEPEKVFVTSIVYEPEPEYGENEPADPMVSQYPLEDILDKYGCYCLDDNGIVGVCTLTEGVLSLLQKEFDLAVGGERVNNYRLGIFSMTDDKIIAELDYDMAIKVLEKNAKSTSDNYILVELNLEELKELIDKCNQI